MYGMSILMVRSRSASMNSLLRSACTRLVGVAMMTSSMSVWANFLGLMRCSARHEQVVQEGHVELEHLDELHDAAVAMLTRRRS